jgi:hypothetical protein
VKQGTGHVSEPSDPILELFEEDSVLKGPPEATLARRAKSYSDFYDVAVSYLGKEPKVEKPRDVFENLEIKAGASTVENRYEECEDELLDASQEEYQYVNPIESPENHLLTVEKDCTGINWLFPSGILTVFSMTLLLHWIY